MDLIYMNSAREDIGVLPKYELDMAFGTDENNFECVISADAHCCDAGFYLYIDGTEYGGVIDAIASKSGTKEVVYSGRTWHGVLNSKVLEPDSGEDYLTVDGEANTAVGILLDRMGLTDLFTVSAENSQLTVNNYQMNRYIKGYDGIRKMLDSVGGKLKFTVDDGQVVLSCDPKVDYTQDEEFDSDQVDFDAKKSTNTVNHLICLGSGELSERTVLHLYADEEGNFSETQTLFGLDEVAEVYDYSAVESVDELRNSGYEKLKELWATDELIIDFDADSEAYDIGDVVGAMDNITGISISAEITKKIVTIKNGRTTISYKVGD